MRMMRGEMRRGDEGDADVEYASENGGGSGVDALPIRAGLDVEIRLNSFFYNGFRNNTIYSFEFHLKPEYLVDLFVFYRLPKLQVEAYQ